jgi:predicted HAD superfamily Cof-like phosphohydrolase
MADFVDEVIEFNDLAGNPTIFTVRNVALYTGCQLEEMAEKLQAITAGIDTQALKLHSWRLAYMIEEIDALGKAFKNGLYDKVVETCDRHEVLDADIDISVFSIGSMRVSGADVQGACHEVMRANLDKRFPDTGKFHRDDNGKIIKPKGWKPADLTPFVGK